MLPVESAGNFAGERKRVGNSDCCSGEVRGWVVSRVGRGTGRREGARGGGEGWGWGGNVANGRRGSGEKRSIARCEAKLAAWNYVNRNQIREFSISVINVTATAGFIRHRRLT